MGIESKENPQELTFKEFLLLIAHNRIVNKENYIYLNDSDLYVRIWQLEESEEEGDKRYSITRHTKGFGINSLLVQYDYRLRYPKDFDTSKLLFLKNMYRQSTETVIDLGKTDSLEELELLLRTNLGIDNQSV